MGKHNYCTRCFDLVDTPIPLNKKPVLKVNPNLPSVEVCVCGHGKVHHQGITGDCTCPLTWKHTKCSCVEFKLDWCIINHQKMQSHEFEQYLQDNREVSEK